MKRCGGRQHEQYGVAGNACLGGGSAPRFIVWRVALEPIENADRENVGTDAGRSGSIRADARLERGEGVLRPAGAGDVREGRRGAGL